MERSVASTATRTPERSAPSVGRITTSGQVTWWETPTATEPSRRDRTGPRPREPMTTIDARVATSSSTWRGSPNPSSTCTSSSGARAATSARTSASSSLAWVSSASRPTPVPMLGDMPTGASQTVSMGDRACTSVSGRRVSRAWWTAKSTARSDDGEPSTAATIVPRGASAVFILRLLLPAPAAIAAGTSRLVDGGACREGTSVRMPGTLDPGPGPGLSEPRSATPGRR